MRESKKGRRETLEGGRREQRGRKQREGEGVKKCYFLSQNNRIISIVLLS